jgi:F-type H+-transporting ATPase subunit epsilon
MVETSHGGPAGTQQLRCVVVTPERAVLDEGTDFVALPMYDGELGVMPGRLALIGRLGYGELRIGQGTQAQRWFVDGGFAQVRADVVTVLTARATKAADINVAAAEQSLQQALDAPPTTPEAQEANYRTQQRARAQLRMAGTTPAAGGGGHH